jgi:hypothetical protein
MLAKGWDDTIRKARKALTACEGKCRPKPFTRCASGPRITAPIHLLLHPLWPAAMTAKYNAASGLIELLGRVNDLELLCDLVETEHHHFDNADDLAHLLYAIIFHQQHDRHDALTRAEDIFGVDADDEATRIELLWIAFGG